METANASQSRLILLDGLRGIAAVLVVLYHFNSIRGQHGLLFDAGYLAVDFFFILSGFVLTLAFERKFASGLGALDFMRLRVLRLWPALTIGAVLGALAMTLVTPSPLIVPLLLLTLVMVPVLNQGGVLYVLNSVQWSLGFELIGNLLHVLLLSRLSQRALLVFCLINAALLVGIIITFGTIAVGSMADNFVYGLPRVGFSYSLGVLFARRWSGEPTATTIGWKLVLVAPVAVLVGVSITPATLRGLAEGLAVLVLLPLVFQAAIRSRAPDAVQPVLIWLGAISYPLYAVHYPVLTMFTWANTQLYSASPPALWNAAALITAIGVAQSMMAIASVRNRSSSLRTSAAGLT